MINKNITINIITAILLSVTIHTHAFIPNASYMLVTSGTTFWENFTGNYNLPFKYKTTYYSYNGNPVSVIDGLPSSSPRERYEILDPNAPNPQPATFNITWHLKLSPKGRRGYWINFYDKNNNQLHAEPYYGSIPAKPNELKDYVKGHESQKDLDLSIARDKTLFLLAPTTWIRYVVNSIRR